MLVNELTIVQSIALQKEIVWFWEYISEFLQFYAKILVQVLDRIQWLRNASASRDQQPKCKQQLGQMFARWKIHS